MLTVSGDDNSRILYVDTSPFDSTTISGLRLTDGYEGAGAAVLNGGPGSLNLTRVTITSSEAAGPGGAVLSGGGKMRIEQSTISGNQAAIGGAIAQYEGELRIIDSTISGNRAYAGAGLIGLGGTLRTSNSTFAGNAAEDIGGGMYTVAGSSYLSNTTFSGNSVDPAGNPGTGGAIATDSQKYLGVESTTITNNRAVEGGGIAATYSGTAPVLHNSIVAGNTAATDADLTAKPDSGQLAVDASYSLIGSTTGANVRTTVAGSNILNQGAALAPLASNGGPTQTHAIPENSPAFDAGDPTNFLRTDQRGIARPQFIGPDIGSFELQDTEAPTTTLKGPRTKVKTRKDKVSLRADFLASEGGSTFTCDVTGGKLESDPSTCTSPLRYEIPAGSKKKTTYTLEVFATDATGNVGPPVTAKTTFIKKPKRGRKK